ncbi:MAG: substrate-binding domain-containing protein, partial [Actinomycetota bacterium]
AFRRRHPGANVDFTVNHSGDFDEWLENGKVDVALLQTTEERIEPDDVRLWSEDLVWVTSENENFDEQPVPFLDFGAHCYYNSFSHGILERAGIEFRVAFSAPTSFDVRAAVQAGIGVAVMSSRYLCGDVVEWKPPVGLDPLPHIVQVIRTVPGERSDAVDALVETIRNELFASRP